MPYSAEQFFNVVHDVDRYHEFVPFCTQSKVITKQSDKNPSVYDAELTVGFRLFTEKYVSRVTANRPHSIDVCAIQSPTFKHLRSNWKFQQNQDGTCTVVFRLDFAVKSILHAQAMDLFLQEVAQYQIKAFQNRCKSIYGNNNNSNKNNQSATSTSTSGSTSTTTVTKTQTATATATMKTSVTAAQTHINGASGSSAPSSTIEKHSIKPARVSTYAKERKWLEHVFAKHCSDGPDHAGRLDLAALMRACHDLERLDGFEEVSKNPGLAAAVFSAIDTNPSDGWISLSEFTSGIYILTRAIPEERAEHFFDKMDTDDNGFLEQSEVTTLLER